jgi:hypothetical protein
MPAIPAILSFSTSLGATAAMPAGSEVILGALVGGIFHWAAEILVDTITGVAYRRRAARHVRG